MYFFTILLRGFSRLHNVLISNCFHSALQKKILNLFCITTALWTSIHAATAVRGPLSTKGNQIVTSKGTPVRIQGVNWFGFESPDLTVHGLWTRNWKSMLDQIKAAGFNTIRIPFCNQMLDPGATPKNINFYANKDLENKNSFQILDLIVNYADKIGLWIILDHHRNDAGMGALNNGLWYNDEYPEKRFIDDWVMLANRYKNNPSVIGADIHNEPHESARWGSGDMNDWHAAAQRVGNAILQANPNLLIIVEGVEQYNNQYYWWGGNLMGIKNFPVTLQVPNKLVYSTHDYPNSIHAQPWFSDPTYPNNLSAKFRAAWGYIFEDNIAPIIVGEFGSKFIDPKDSAWMTKITAYLNGDFNGTGTSRLPAGKQGISWIWWAWNPNSGDTGGMLKGDWNTIEKEKLDRLKPLFTSPKVEGTGKETPAPTPTPTLIPISTPVVSTTTPGSSCLVQYTIKDQWDTGFVVDVTLHNKGTTNINGWTVEFAFPGNQKITNSWKGTFTSNGNVITIKDASYNSTIPAGGSVTFGFEGTYQGTNSNPTLFNLNGTPCK